MNIEDEQLVRLQLLDLRENGFTGELPMYLTNFINLKVLILSYNNLEGNVPQWITNFTYLQGLDLSNNKFTAEIPSNLEKLEGFRVNATLNLGIDTLYEDITVEIKGFESTLTYVLATNTILDLSNNHFTGGIPTSIGSLSSMRLLNLPKNQFEGPIPASLSNISTLEQMDLDKNNLSGNIPPQLSQLFMLGVFDVSYNNLCGQIPRGTQFSTFKEISFQRNKCLCGFPLPPCQVKGARGPLGRDSGGNTKTKVRWLKHLDGNMSLITLGIRMGIGFGGVVSMLILWKRPRNWLMPPIQAQRFYGMYRLPK